MSDFSVNTKPHSISVAYENLVNAVQQETRTEQESVKEMIEHLSFSQEDLEKKTFRIVGLYELILLFENVGVIFKEHLKESIDFKTIQPMKQVLLTLMSDLKTAWEKEVHKDLQDKTKGLLDEITQKEKSIKQAINKRQQEIQTYVQKVTEHAKKAQTIR